MAARVRGSIISISLHNPNTFMLFLMSLKTSEVMPSMGLCYVKYFFYILYVVFLTKCGGIFKFIIICCFWWDTGTSLNEVWSFPDWLFIKLKDLFRGCSFSERRMLVIPCVRKANLKKLHHWENHDQNSLSVFCWVKFMFFYSWFVGFKTQKCPCPYAWPGQ